MPDPTPTDKFVEKFTEGELYPPTHEILPLRPPKAFHKQERSLYGLVRFPVKVLLVAFREVFSDMDRWRYQNSRQDTNIYIEDKYPQLTRGESERTECKPALITDRGDITERNVDGRQNNRRISMDTKLLQFSDILQVPMTIHCLSKEGPEAEDLAAVVFGILKTDEDVFKQRGVHSVLNKRIGPEGPFIQEVELGLMDVPVSFTMEYTWSWARKSDGRPLEKIASMEITDP